MKPRPNPTPTYGDFDQGLVLFDATIDSFQQAGNVIGVASTLTNLAVFFDRIERPELAATVYGASTHSGIITIVISLPSVLDHLRSVLGETVFDDYVATGAAMEPAEAVRYARHQIRLARAELVSAS